MSALTIRRPSRIPAAPLAILIGVTVGALLILASGENPLTAYWAILRGALAPANLPDTLNWAVPLVGMTLVAALPLRGGLVNLGGDGQLVIGGLVAALTPLYLPPLAPGPIAAAVAILAAMLASGLYASLAAWGETRLGVPMLISSLLLSYPAIGLTSYIVGFPFARHDDWPGADRDDSRNRPTGDDRGPAEHRAHPDGRCRRDGRLL